MRHLRRFVLNQMEECISIKRVNMCFVCVLQAKEADNIIKLLRKDQNKVCFNLYHAGCFMYLYPPQLLSNVGFQLLACIYMQSGRNVYPWH